MSFCFHEYSRHGNTLILNWRFCISFPFLNPIFPGPALNDNVSVQVCPSAFPRMPFTFVFYLDHIVQ